MRLVIVLLAAVSIGPVSQVLAATAQEPPASAASQSPAEAPPASSAPQSAADSVPNETPATKLRAASDPAGATRGQDQEQIGSSTPVSLIAGDADAQQELKVLKAAGYKPEVHGSEIWFCRKEVIMGSRFEKKICNTADELRHIAADAQQQTDKITRRISGDPITHNP
jgi:hypothetical protein